MNEIVAKTKFEILVTQENGWVVRDIFTVLILGY